LFFAQQLSEAKLLRLFLLGFDPGLHLGVELARGGDASDLENTIELVNDIWSYFPHKIIGGLSLAEKILEYNRN